MNIDGLFSVAGKTVLITGGSSGLGLMMAEGFLKAGARVYITGRKPIPLEEARRALAAFGEVHSVQCDLGTPEGQTTLVDALLDCEDHLHVLINNAGKSWGAAFGSYPDSAWNQLMTLNVQAPFALTQRLLPLLERAASADNPARIINIGSIAALVNDDLNAFAYTSSKAALHRLTQQLARELAPKKILVNAIAPGWFPSKMSAPILKNEEWRARELANIPLGRFGEPEDIAGLAIYLSSRAGAFMTGSILTLDGGTTVS